MFEKIGRKLVKGAKAEILEAPKAIDWNKVLDAVVKIAEAGIFIAAVLTSGKNEPTVVNHYHYYIRKGE